MRRTALFGVCLAAAIACLPAAASGKTKVFSSGPINMPIPDAVGNNFGTGVLSNLRIKKLGKVKDVNVAVRITHPNTTDLTLDLSHGAQIKGLVDVYPKDGVALSPDFGAGAAACQGAAFTVFDDEAAASITVGTNPFAGPFRPETALAAFDGGRLQGGWSLGLLDGYTKSAGTLNCWQLTIRYKPQKRK